MLLAVTVLVVPIAFVLNDAEPLTVNTSPDNRSSRYVTVADVVPSYGLLVAVIVTASGFAVISAVAVGEPDSESV